ncbi:YscW family type III secretion system pilotin [Photobacterium leiognathi]|uniref:YscW family type III secretion system pilotin n=1 Tax=Photobacterium leiognathi TaxID=553611 RepID=UPI002980FB10|nr:YscW family type III secretion system pilotin [Photobacterium leiognathi]
MKSNVLFLLLSILFLSACAHKNPLKGGGSSDSQAVLYGWVNFNEYISPISTFVDIEVCKVVKERCITVVKQRYKGVQLPVQYSFVVAPTQAGNGEMKIRAVLRSQGEVRASKEEQYLFTQGSIHRDIMLEAYKNY